MHKYEKGRSGVDGLLWVFFFSRTQENEPSHELIEKQREVLGLL